MSTICPYCNIEVSESAIEAEDGCCPECGALLMKSSQLFGDEDELDVYDEGDNYDSVDEEDDDVYGNADSRDDIYDDLGDDFGDDFGDDDDFDDDFESKPRKRRK